MIPATPLLIGLLLSLAALACVKARPLIAETCKRMPRTTAAVLAACAVNATITAYPTAADKNEPRIDIDALLRDAGCYATNDVFHVAVENAPNYAALDFSASPVLVYAREHGSSANWVELLPRRLFGALPADYAIQGATNYDYLVYLDYIPPSPVHTNGVFELHGFLIPGNGDEGTGNGELGAGFINSLPILQEEL